MFWFQSTRPRGARPERHTALDDARHVSIHAPTRGATFLHAISANLRIVSIHAPTRGATSTAELANCAIEFQSTRPRGARL